MASVFISYSHEDSDVAQRLCGSLEANDLSVFLDRDTLVGGEDVSQVIAHAISKADAVVVLLSRHSKRTRWVEDELQRALEQEKVVIPILLDSEAKNNWVWPLVADRDVVTVDKGTNFGKLARQLKAAITDTISEERSSIQVLAKYMRSPSGLAAVTVMLLPLGGMILRSLAPVWAAAPVAAVGASFVANSILFFAIRRTPSHILGRWAFRTAAIGGIVLMFYFALNALCIIDVDGFRIVRGFILTSDGHTIMSNASDNLKEVLFMVALDAQRIWSDVLIVTVALSLSFCLASSLLSVALFMFVLRNIAQDRECRQLSSIADDTS